MTKRFVIVQNSIKTTYIFRLSYIKELIKNGDVIVIAPNDSQYHYNELNKLGVEVYNIPEINSILNKIHSIFLMNYYVFKERLKGSVFICHFLVTFIMTYFTLVPFNKKLLIYTEGLGSLFSKSEKLQRILSFFLKRNKATRFFCNEDERSKLGKDNDKVTYGIGINISSFKSKKYSITKSDGRYYNIVYVGRLISDKGVVDALNVLSKLLTKRNDIRMIFVGDIYPNNPSSLSLHDIKTYKSQFGEHVSFESFTKNIKRIYDDSHILIIPSIREGFPVCVMESSSMGIPSVGYRVPGVVDAIHDGVNGLLSDYKDINNMVENILSLLTENSLMKYKASSVRYASENFDSSIKDNYLIQVINKL